MANLGVSPSPQRSFGGAQSFQEDPAQYREDAALVSKLIHLLDHSDTDVLYEMLAVARNHLNSGKRQRTQSAYVALVFSALKLAKRILEEETMGETKEKAPKEEEKQVENGEESGETPPTEESKEDSGVSNEEGEKEEKQVENGEESGETPPTEESKEDLGVSNEEGEKPAEEEAKPVEQEAKPAESAEAKETPVAAEKPRAPKSVR
jgi:vacuolar protein sorting-associated protein 35